MITFQNPDQELIIVWMLRSQSLNFVEGGCQVDLWEFIWSFFHIVDGEVISFEELEGECP